MRLKFIDLFSGTGSVAKIARKYGYDVRTLDCDERRDVDYLEDILRFDYQREFCDWMPDVIWASPPCTYYSCANQKAPRNLRLANKIVRRVLEIIDWVHKKNPNGVTWILENPQTGLLKDQAFMKDLPYIDADYCQYGYPYRKRTRFWTNNDHLELRLCPGVGRCKFMVGQRHVSSVGNHDPVYGECVPVDVKFTIPAPLLRKLIDPRHV